MTSPIIQKIESELSKNRIVLFVKGSPQAPMCGFSAATMKLFDQLGATYHTVDVLTNPDIRASLPEYSGWPTFPQVFIDKELVGGCDIVHEMHQNGELKSLIDGKSS